MRTRLTVAVISSLVSLMGSVPAHGLAATAVERLAGAVPRGLDRLPNLGPTAPGTPVHIGLVLRRPDEAGEAIAYRAMYDPTSPSYHDFLLPSTFAARFGVAATTRSAADRFLTSRGLEITERSAAGDYLYAEGTAAQAEATFDVRLHDVRTAEGVRHAPVDAPMVPSGLGVVAVLGLDDIRRFHPLHDRPRASSPAQTSCSGGKCTGALTARDVRSIYDLPAGNLGEGESMAVFGEGNTESTIRNLRLFEADNGLPRVPVRVVSVGKGPFTDNSNETEWELDTQASHGMAPGAYGETLYFGNDLSDASIEATFASWASDPAGPRQADASFGGCEAFPGSSLLASTPVGMAVGPATIAAVNATLRQATMEGRTLFSAAGDSASGCFFLVGGGQGTIPQPVELTMFPASSPYAVSVGGTVLDGDGAPTPHRVSESAWTFTGGGTSPFIRRPDYQAGVPAIAGRCLSDDSGAPANTAQPCRGVPDVAALSGDSSGNGLATWAFDARGVAFGTSLSGPLWMGIWARLQAAAPLHGGAVPGQGFANETLYRVGKDPAKDARDFFDVTSGSNVLFTATPRNAANPSGWDYVSGFGVPDAAHLITDVDGSVALTHPLVPPPASDPPPSPCDHSGVITDPAGDATEVGPLGSVPLFPSDPALDIVRAFPTVDAQRTAVTLHVQVTNLAASEPTGQSFVYFLTYDGDGPYVDATRTSSGTSFTLVGTDHSGAAVSSPLQGTFDDVAGEVRVILPFAAYNAAMHPVHPLAAGAAITDTQVFSFRATPGKHLRADETVNNACPFILGAHTVTAGAGTAPATRGMTAGFPALPDTRSSAPALGGTGVVGLGIGAVIAWVRRRQRATRAW